ncbi:hypothetical protein [Bacillus sp. REN10]|uniref:hypothetical protein n=1 Tax=Bacillus sp. REN10 TaxID=2782541 RepID=UPI00193B755F|nr:hypothetical protein [Bacillus sp. REN10]
MNPNYDVETALSKLEAELKQVQFQLKEEMPPIQEIKQLLQHIQQQMNTPIIIHHSFSDTQPSPCIEQLEYSQLTLNQCESSIAKVTHTMDLIQKQLKLLEKEMNQLNAIISRTTGKDSIVYQQFHIDHLYLDKYELTNNLGQLGVKELSGSLHIGASYGNIPNPEEMTDKQKELLQKFKKINKEK